MKLIGKQIVVELPEKKKEFVPYPLLPDGRQAGWNDALSEVARMNQAWEVDVEELTTYLNRRWVGNSEANIIYLNKYCSRNIAIAIASDPSAWLKRKE